MLGVNSDEKDELGTADTTFIEFKKYYQRAKANCDLDLAQMVEKLQSACDNGEGNLIVIGHSLDETDKDTLKELFGAASTIFVHYHNMDALGAYITNMVKLFGKEEFDRMRRCGELYFLELPQIGLEGAK